MKYGLSKVLAGVALVALAGCVGTDYDKVKNDAPASGAFNQGLQSGYVELSGMEYKEGDYRDSDTFAKRSRAAKSGQPTSPEAIGARHLPSDKVDELSNARARLMSALDGSPAQKNPAAAAKAQVMFDCWMQEQEENFQPKDIAWCKDNFDAAMAELENKPVTPAALMSPNRYLVFFDFDKSNLTPDGKELVSTAVDNAKKGDVSSITVVGHTDTAGPSKYNEALSARRALSVKKEMVSEGIAEGSIMTEARGEADLLVQTADGVPEPQNRRAEILFGKPGS